MELNLKNDDIVFIKTKEQEFSLSVDKDDVLYLNYGKKYFKLTDLMESKQTYEIGDKVKVINKGMCYSSYFDWARKYIPEGYHWEGGSPTEKEEYIIVNKEKHLDDKSKMIYAICREYLKRCYIVDEGAFLKK